MVGPCRLPWRTTPLVLGPIILRNWDKSLNSFPPSYSQSPLLTDFIPTPLWAKVVWNRFVMYTLYTDPQVWELSRLWPKPFTNLRNCTLINSGADPLLNLHTQNTVICTHLYRIQYICTPCHKFTDETNEPTKEGPTSYVLFESQFTSVSTVRRGPPLSSLSG
jgi:hypothetical protein